MNVIRLQISVSLENAKIPQEASSVSALKASSSPLPGGGVWVSVFCYTSFFMKQVYSFCGQNWNSLQIFTKWVEFLKVQSSECQMIKWLHLAPFHFNLYQIPRGTQNLHSAAGSLSPYIMTKICHSNLKFVQKIRTWQDSIWT